MSGSKHLKILSLSFMIFAVRAKYRPYIDDPSHSDTLTLIFLPNLHLSASKDPRKICHQNLLQSKNIASTIIQLFYCQALDLMEVKKIEEAYLKKNVRMSIKNLVSLSF